MSLTRRSFAARALALVSTSSAACEPQVRKRVYRSALPRTLPAVYSPAVQWGSLLFLSGKGSGTAPDPMDIRSGTHHVLDSFAQELAAAGSSMDRVLRVTVYLQRPEDVPAMNEVFGLHFPKDPPARTTIITRTPHPTLVEMDMVAGI